VAFVAPPEADAQVYVQPGDKNEHVKLKLTPTGAIVGRVLDADGQPMEGVAVMTEVGGQPGLMATTDDRGLYRIGGLSAGKVRVKAQTISLPFPPEIRTDGTLEVHYADTYHPSASDAKSAMRVEVRPATEVTGVDIRMIRTPIVRVSGKVIGVPQGADNAYITLQPRGMGSRVRPDGNFEMWRLNPGKYTATAGANENGKQFSSAPVPIEVGTSDVENLSLQLLPVEDLHGQVVYGDEDARKLPQPAAPPSPSQRQGAPQTRRVTLRISGMYQSVSPGEIKEDGSFTLMRVAPGTYRVMIAPGAVYVKSMSLGPANFDGDTLDMSAGASGASLTLHVASAKSAVSGVVRDDKGPVGGVHVVLAEETAERGYTRVSVTQEDGSYSITGIAPGKYRIFAVDESDVALAQASLEQFDDIAANIEVHDRETVTRDLKRK
jgi:hypothetical protein